MRQCFAFIGCLAVGPAAEVVSRSTGMPMREVAAIAFGVASVLACLGGLVAIQLCEHRNFRRLQAETELLCDEDYVRALRVLDEEFPQ